MCVNGCKAFTINDSVYKDNNSKYTINIASYLA